MHKKNSEKIDENLYQIKKVYDPFLRILHWWNALAIFSLMLTIWIKPALKEFENWKEVLYHFHTYLGYGLICGITLRVLWGVIGPEHAKFINMFNFNVYLNFFKTRKIQFKNDWGHDAFAGTVYLKIYFILILQCISGLYLSAKIFGIGPFNTFVELSKEKTLVRKIFKESHEIIFYILMAFIAIHIFMLIYTEIKHKFPLAQSMLSGYQYRRKK